jgi:hypothetical protein
VGQSRGHHAGGLNIEPDVVFGTAGSRKITAHANQLPDTALDQLPTREVDTVAGMVRAALQETVHRRLCAGDHDGHAAGRRLMQQTTGRS